jgi:hypothetical protein
MVFEIDIRFSGLFALPDIYAAAVPGGVREIVSNGRPSSLVL